LKTGFAIKRLALGFTFIVLASSVLLFSDLAQRKSGPGRAPRIAILQHASTAILDDTVRGVLAALQDGGFRDGDTAAITRYNAENDVPTDNAIAKEITDGRFDLVISVSTLSTQAVANANKAGKTFHVFGGMADPFSAGIGVSRERPMDHPPQLVGIGTFMPVASNFEMARRMFPGLKTVGVVWNPAESNSRAYTLKAREICQTLGIELLEANVDNSSGVGEAASSLVSRGAQALWIGGDVTVVVGADAVIKAAKQSRIPVFTLTPPTAKLGGLFDLGANLETVGYQVGELAVKILKGAKPSDFPVENKVPERLLVNKVALNGLKDPWTIPEDVAARADTVIDGSGVHDKVAPAAANKPLNKQWHLSAVGYVDAPSTEDSKEGFVEGLREAGLTEGRDFVIRWRSAQGDIAILNGIIDATLTEGADMIVVHSTPTLQVALKKVTKAPIVFALVASGVMAGAGKTDADHMPNVTGATVLSPFDDMLALIREIKPGVKRCGTVFTPAEVNSTFNHGLMIEAAKKVGIEIESVGATSGGDVTDAALALMSKHIDVVCQISDNLTASTFVTIGRAAARAKLPVFSFNSAQAKQGASVSLARDFKAAGREAGLIAARVMRGESPASIPFKLTSRVTLAINESTARASGLTIPPAVLKRADEVVNVGGLSDAQK